MGLYLFVIVNAEQHIAHIKIVFSYPSIKRISSDSTPCVPVPLAPFFPTFQLVMEKTNNNLLLHSA